MPHDPKKMGAKAREDFSLEKLSGGPPYEVQKGTNVLMPSCAYAPMV